MDFNDGEVEVPSENTELFCTFFSLLSSFYSAEENMMCIYSQKCVSRRALHKATYIATYSSCTFYFYFSGLNLKLIYVCRSYESNPEDSLQQLEQLTTEPNLSLAVRVGDVYAFIIQHHYASQNYNQVVNVICSGYYAKSFNLTKLITKKTVFWTYPFHGICPVFCVRSFVR